MKKPIIKSDIIKYLQDHGYKKLDSGEIMLGTSRGHVFVGDKNVLEFSTMGGGVYGLDRFMKELKKRFESDSE